MRTELVNIENSEVIKIQQFQDIVGTYEFIIENEDDSLGNIIQSYIYNTFVREKKKFNGIECTYAGYICPHPLKTIMIIRITLDGVSEPKSFISFFETVCKDIIDEMVTIKTRWNRFAIDNNVS
jgi:DNA-directed RNA polymerase subunit L